MEFNSNCTLKNHKSLPCINLAGHMLAVINSPSSIPGPTHKEDVVICCFVSLLLLSLQLKGGRHTSPFSLNPTALCSWAMCTKSPQQMFSAHDLKSLEPQLVRKETEMQTWFLQSPIPTSPIPSPAWLAFCHHTTSPW